MSARSDVTALWALILKDLRLFLRDKRALTITLAVPIALGALMGGVTGGSGKPRDLPIRIVDLDDSPITREIVAKLAADSTVKLLPGSPGSPGATPDPVADARASVGAGDVDVAAVFPKGFGESAGQAFFGGAARPELRLLYDPSHATTRAVVEGILTEKVMQVVSARIFDADAGADIIQTSAQRLQADTSLDPVRRAALLGLLSSVTTWQQAQKAAPGAGTGTQAGPAGGKGGGFRLPYEAVSEPVTAEGATYNGFAHSIAGMGVQFVLFTGIELAVGILNERQRGLWRRFRAAPLSKGTLLLARVLSGAIIATGVFSALMAAGVAFFHVEIHGSLLGLALTIGAYGLMSASFGLAIAAVGRTVQAARGLSTFAVLIMTMLGGAWIPMFLFPPLLQTLTLAVPTRWAMDAIDGMTWRGLGLTDALPAVGVLLGFAALFAAIGAARFRWDADG